MKTKEFTKVKQILECPEEVPGIEFGEPVQAEYERTVVASDFFGAELPEGRILIQHNCWFRPVKTPVKAHLTLARVAGYRDAIYGLPEEHFPILFEHPDNPNVLISTTPLSNYVEGRFTPKADWQIVFGRLKAWLDGRDEVDLVDWEMSVRPIFPPAQQLPEDAEKDAFDRNAEWFSNNVFFEHANKIGVFEGYISGIEPNGRQSPRPKTRADCSGEAPMIPAINWALNKNYAARKMAGRIMDNLFNGPELADNNPSSPTYGGLNFYEYIPAFYSDDNCRASMGCILTSELTENYDYVPNILRCLLMVLRSTGKQGFRRGRLDNPASFADGKTWLDYQQEDYVEYRPHYQAYMWAGFLQAYALTGHKEFYDKAENAIRMTMRVFPKLVWTNGITQEYARLILPLAFLVEVSDTEEHRFWLRTAAKTLLDNMAECGAIREMMGDPEYGKYPAPRSNEEYGTTEASLIQRNGDPACDLVYTVNYAFAGLNEAAVATGDDYYKAAADKMADFLCRIQVKSKTQPYLDGCWMRGFDYELWEFFGSSADNGWGAWCVESGWTNTWIGATMGLRTLGRGLLCRKSAPEYKKIFAEIHQQMSKVENNINSGGALMRNTAPGAE
jgi:hypothetical protein